MTFAQRLAATAALIEQHLGALLSESTLVGAAPEPHGARLVAAMRHASLGGGKRLRPFLVIESAGLFGVPPKAARDAACAVELVHCYSLAHDDLPAMDNDPMRRGQPTVWRQFDEWTAILAGDALLTLAFEVMARPSTHPDPAVRIDLVQGLARASGAAGMVGGQALDLMADKLSQPPVPSQPHVRALQGMKTGALLAFAGEAGAILGRAGADERADLQRFATALGAAFQIADDLLDHEGDPSIVGKAVAKDAGANKATLVSLLGPDAARSKLRDVEAEALSALDRFGTDADVLRAAVHFVVTRNS